MRIPQFLYFIEYHPELWQEQVDLRREPVKLIQHVQDMVTIEQFVWIFPLEIAGSNRVEHNAESQDEDYRLFSIDEDLDARNEQLSHRPEHEEIEERLAQEEEIALLHAVICLG